MSSWQLIFLQSKANDGLYDEDDLSPQNRTWTRDTWFQKRLHYVREMQWQILRRVRPTDLEAALPGR